MIQAQEEQRRMEQQRQMENQRQMEEQRIVEQRRVEEQRMMQMQQEQMRMEEMRRVEEQKNQMAGMEMSQMTQQMSQMSQSYTSTQQQSSNEVYESTQMGGITKGYRRKDDDELAAERDMTRNSQQFIQDNGIFGGITGDHNSLLQDSQFDSKKHSVKDLAGHFAKLRPKAEIPVQYLPEQKMFNGQQGPSLNYLNSNSSSSSQQSTLTRSTTSKQDSNASRQEYEMRKAQSNQNNTEQSSSSSSVAQSSSVEMRSKTEASTQQKKLLSERRQSLKDYMLMDPAAIHASAGIIDPSAILRGSDEGTGERSRSEGLINPANIAVESENLSGKWDNHNTIARGWAGAKANYHPVTFRNIYNVDSQNQINA